MPKWAAQRNNKMSKTKFTDNINPDEQTLKLLRRGTELLQRGDAEQAARILEKARALQPANPDIALNLGGAYILSGKFSQATTILEPLSLLEPDNAMVWTNLGAAYLGNPILARDAEQQKAIAAFERALEINPIAPNVAYNLGLIFRDRKENEQAVYWFGQAIKANPNDQDARRLLERLSAEEEGN
jgi:Flp pilus assembly protein TadD